MDPVRLRAIPLFGALGDHVLRTAAEVAEERSVTAGEQLVREGDLALELLAVLEGEADVTRDGRPLRTLGPGDVFGELALVEKRRRTATVTARTAMRLVTLSADDVRRAGGALDGLLAAVAARHDR